MSWGLDISDEWDAFNKLLINSELHSELCNVFEIPEKGLQRKIKI